MMKIGKIDLGLLTLRERWFLLGGGGAVLLFLLYLFVWVPLSDSLDSLRQTVKNQLVLHEWMAKNLEQMKKFQALGLSVQEVKKENFLPLVEEFLTKQGLNGYVDKIQEREGKIAINFQEVPFDKIMEWLEMLWKTYAISVYQMNVEKRKEEGVVKVDLLLRMN